MVHIYSAAWTVSLGFGGGTLTYSNPEPLYVGVVC